MREKKSIYFDARTLEQIQGVQDLEDCDFPSAVRIILAAGIKYLTECSFNIPSVFSNEQGEIGCMTVSDSCTDWHGLSDREA